MQLFFLHILNMQLPNTTLVKLLTTTSAVKRLRLDGMPDAPKRESTYGSGLGGYDCLNVLRQTPYGTVLHRYA